MAYEGFLTMESATDYFNYSLAAMAFHSIRAIGIAVIGSLCIYFIRVHLKRKILEIYPDPLRVNVIIRLLTYAMFFIIVTIVLHEFGINVTALVGAAGVLGVAVGFASQTTISNIISGLFIMLTRPFDLNDLVSINQIDGRVKELSLFATTIRTLDNKIVRIPNEQVVKSNIINVSKEPFRGFQTTIDLAPESDIHKAMQIVEELSKNLDYLLSEPKPFCSVLEITGTYSRLMFRVWAKQEMWLTTRRKFLADAKDAFEKNDIKLATVHIFSKQ